MPHSSYMREKIGTAQIDLEEPLVAGSLVSFNLVYTAGYFGIDDSGSIKIVQRFASDMARPQFDNPTAPNFVSIEARNGATLAWHFDVKENIRPWGKTLYIKIVKGFFREGDQLIVRFGDPRQGCPGIRMQTFCEETFELKVLVDAFATYDYVELPESPVLKIVPGKPVKWQAILPSLRNAGQPFSLALKAEDWWGNPSDQIRQSVRILADHPVANLPASVSFKSGQFTALLENLVCETPGDVTVSVFTESGEKLAVSNPLRIAKNSKIFPYWGDLHGQSEETIGTNSAWDYFRFARDRAFLDVICHQGNDFQITRAFWAQLQKITAAFYQPGKMVTFPGYEWSGNTGLGGDHNVIYLNEGETLHRSSHALVADFSDADTDCYTTRELFQKLKERQAFVYAHVGGRYANLDLAKNVKIPLAVEIHSAWGSFEWLLHDAFAAGLTPGIVANSDGHKGRPGASYPGASLFGSYGGLTAFWCPELTREAIFDCLRRRHHFATTGARMLLQTGLANFSQIQMGDFMETKTASVALTAEILCPGPLERVEFFNGTELITSVRPVETDPASRCLRIVWEGAEYRGRGRETVWDGFAEVTGNRNKQVRSINFWNPEKPLRQETSRRVCWQSLTTGGFSGFDLILEDARAGELKIHTPLVQLQIPICEITEAEMRFDAGGLGRKLRIFRALEENLCRQIRLVQQINLKPGQMNPLYLRVTQSDGHRGWTSPIYVKQGA